MARHSRKYNRDGSLHDGRQYLNPFRDDLPAAWQLRQAVNVVEPAGYDNTDGPLLRDRRGRFVKPGSKFYPEAEEYAIERLFDQYLASRPPARGNRELGTYRPNTRIEAELRRERDRRTTCVVCGGALPKGSRSNKVTCSAACRQKLSRQERARRKTEGTRFDLVPTAVRHAYVAHIDGYMAPTQTLSPLTKALIDAVVDAWRVPLPVGIEDEHEWREGQARDLLSLVHDERASGRPSVTRFGRRARAFIKHMERLSRSDTTTGAAK